MTAASMLDEAKQTRTASADARLAWHLNLLA
jgi:hypothetical protein